MSQQNVLCYSLKEIYPADSAIHPSIKRSQSCPDIFEYPAQIDNNGQRLKINSDQERYFTPLSN